MMNITHPNPATRIERTRYLSVTTICARVLYTSEQTRTAASVYKGAFVFYVARHFVETRPQINAFAEADPSRIAATLIKMSSLRSGTPPPRPPPFRLSAWGVSLCAFSRLRACNNILHDDRNTTGQRQHSEYIDRG